MVLLKIRSHELAKWRRTARDLAAQLADIEETAQVNDDILLTLHKLSLLLIKKPSDWQARVEQLLKKQFQLSHCRLQIFSDAAAGRAVAKLPVGGEVTTTPPPGMKWRGAASYFLLPLRSGRRTVGLLIFASREKNAFPVEMARDLVRRLAELIAAAA